MPDLAGAAFGLHRRSQNFLLAASLVDAASAFWNDRRDLSLVQEIAVQRSQNQEEEP
ncbi:hypothetical protein [Mesorhizobium amorphae]